MSWIKLAQNSLSFISYSYLKPLNKERQVGLQPCGETNNPIRFIQGTGGVFQSEICNRKSIVLDVYRLFSFLKRQSLIT